MSKPFNVTIQNGIAELIFNKPPVNAFTSQGWADIAAEIEALGHNEEARVIIIAAEGRGFCAGVDIKELDADDDDQDTPVWPSEAFTIASDGLVWWTAAEDNDAPN